MIRTITVLAAVLASLGSATSAGQDATVDLPQGTIKGLARATDNVFYNIPYAQPPTGDNRFRPPETPAPKWSGVRDGSVLGPWCFQNGKGKDNGASEDCLQLNVYQPRPAAGAGAQQPRSNATKIPVAVWIHGGAFEEGSAVFFEPIYLMGDLQAAPNGNAGKFIVVTVNYRLAVLGFLGSDKLRSRDAANGSTGNYGMQDQREAIKWVRDNIAVFGGDPTAITIFGESAGAGSITNHLVMPKSKGLYRAAVLESGSFTTWSAHPLVHAEKIFARSLLLTGCANVECLVGLDVHTLLTTTGSISFDDEKTPMGEYSNTSLSEGPFSCPWAPLIDGVELSAHPLVLAKNGHVDAKATILHGTNLDEAEMFTNSLSQMLAGPDYTNYMTATYGAANASVVSKLYATQTYPHADTVSKLYWQAMRSATDYFFTCPARLVSKYLSATPGRTVYNYMFSYHGSNPRNTFVPHAEELGYVWGGGVKSVADGVIAQEMTQAWGSFFYAMTPGDDLGWKPYTSSPNGATFVLDSESKMIDGYAMHACDTFYEDLFLSQLQ